MKTPGVVLFSRNLTIDKLIRECAEGKLPFSGPDSLWEKVTRMGFRGTNLHEMVCAKEAELKANKKPD